MMFRTLVGWIALAVLSASPALAQQAPAATRPTLTVYTYSSFVGRFGPGAVIKERFEAVCGCTLEWVASDNSGAILGRLRLEGDATRADVVLGLDASITAEARATGLFQPHGQDNAALSLPIPWTDTTFLPFDWSHMAFMYNAERLPNPPTSLRELVENPNGPRIVIQDPRTSQPGLSMVLWMRQVFADRADAAWAQLRPRIITFTPGWSAAYAMFTRGEADMVLSYTTSEAYHVGAERKANLKAAPFAEGHYLYVETAAALRTTKQPELARRFLGFMLTDAFQTAVPETNWMFPARTPATGLPASFASVHRPARTLMFTPEEVQANRRAFLDGWLSATSR